MWDALRQRILEWGEWKPGELAAAEEEAAARGRSAVEVLAAQGRVDPRRLYIRAGEAYGIPFREAEVLLSHIDPNVARSVPARFQERKRVLPLWREERQLFVASCDPEPRILDLADAFDVDQIELQLVTPADFRRLRWAIDLGQLLGAPPPALRDGVGDLLGGETRIEARHTGLLDALLLDAVGERASDVHLERYSDKVRVRLRIDGDLHDIDRYALSAEDAQALINVLKVRSGLDIAERRRPQDGRTTTRIGGQAFDLRVQVLPALHGEGAAIRFLPQSRERFSVASLGWSEALQAIYRDHLCSPSGLVLVVGPTGCGKSTTLYTGLELLARESSRKVLTVEDPVEYRVERVTQTQVHPEIGVSFADSVRAFVRHDPDVIFVGEIRDPETAREALRASQTGHLVLSTLHANDTVDAVQRLYDLGMHPNSIAAELLAVFSQRLLKRICTHCRTGEDPDPAVLRAVFGERIPGTLRAERGAGCRFCGERGSFGRIAAGEYLPTSRALRIAISHHRPLDEIRAVAEQSGIRRMRDHALELVSAGVVRFNELPKAIPIEQLAPSG